MKLLRNTNFSFLPRGMGADILVKNALAVGMLQPPENTASPPVLGNAVHCFVYTDLLLCQFLPIVKVAQLT
jgi:hypothetical protein